MTPTKQTSTAVATLDVRAVAGVGDTYTSEQVDLIRRTIAPGSNDDELALFLSVARDLDLNPLLKEVWCVKQLDRDGTPKTNRQGQEYPAQIMVGRDGLLTLAERTGKFDGLVSGVVKEHDVFEFGLLEPTHRFGYGGEHHTRGKLVGAYAYAYRRDRQYPTRIFAEWAEHGGPMTRNAEGQRINEWSPWSKYPSAMIRKVAEAQALKLAFRASGVVAAGEPDEGDVVEVVEDHRRPVGDLAESSSARSPVGEVSDVSPATSGADSVLEPADGEHLFPPADDSDEEPLVGEFEDPA